MKKDTRAWVRKAEKDYQAAAQLAEGRGSFPDQLCFLCQQASEKYLKALLHERGHVVPRTHDCERLVNLLAPTDPTLAHLKRSAKGLTRFAVDPRYPNLFDTPDASRARTAWNGAERIRAEVRHRLGLRPRP